MSEKDTPEEVPSSGSRWEEADLTSTADAESVTEPTTGESTPQVVPVAAADETQASVATSERSRWATGRAGLIGAGLGIALLAGVGGFAIGNAAADDGDHGRFESERRFDDHADGERPFPGPNGQGGPGSEGFDHGDRPGFGQQLDPRDDSDDSGESSTQGDSGTQG